MAQEVCLCGETSPSYGWPCSHGGCHFVDPEAYEALETRLAAAHAVRPTCGNLDVFDRLIAGQNTRRAMM